MGSLGLQRGFVRSPREVSVKALVLVFLLVMVGSIIFRTVDSPESKMELVVYSYGMVRYQSRPFVSL